MCDIFAGERGRGHAAELDPTTQVVPPWEVDETAYAEDLTNAELLDIALADAVDAVAGGHLIGTIDELAVRRVRRQVRRLVAGAAAVPAGGAA